MKVRTCGAKCQGVWRMDKDWTSDQTYYDRPNTLHLLTDQKFYGQRFDSDQRLVTKKTTVHPVCKLHANIIERALFGGWGVGLGFGSDID